MRAPEGTSPGPDGPDKQQHGHKEEQLRREKHKDKCLLDQCQKHFNVRKKKVIYNDRLTIFGEYIVTIPCACIVMLAIIGKPNLFA